MPAEPLDLAKVLVIEDDPDLRRVLKQGLGDEGFSVRLAHSGAEALTLAGEERPDLVVLDIGLPDADGRDICQALRSTASIRPSSSSPPAMRPATGCSASAPAATTI